MPNGLSQAKMIKEMYEKVIRIETVLLGVKNTDDKGLVKEVHELKDEVGNLANSHFNLNRRVYVLIAVIASTGGAVGGNIEKILSVMGG